MADDISFSAELDTGNFDAGMEILTGALRQVGTIAVDAFMGAAAAAVSFFGDAFAGAMEAETNMARFDAVLNAVTSSSEEQAAAFAEASDSVVTGTYLSAEAMVELQSEVDHANAKLHDMEAAYEGAETHTESQTLALADQRQKVADLAAEVAHGGATFTTTLADQMGLVPPVAHLTRDELLALADEYKNLAGGSDDAVIAAEAVLLKFTQIGRETFPEALAVSADLAAFLGVDMASAAQTLGFALDNPGEALARLNKQTGAFTDTEIETIKAMAEAGDAAGAQALILENLTNTVGGTAEALANTTAGQWAIFQETIADTGEGIMSNLLPPLVQFGQQVLPMILPAIEEFGAALSGMLTAIIPIGTAFGNLVTTIAEGGNPMTGALQGLMMAISAVFGQETSNAIYLNFIAPLQNAFSFVVTNWPLLQATFETVFTAISGVLTVLSDFVTVTLMPAIASIWGETGAQLPTAQMVFETVMAAILLTTGLMADYITNVLIPVLTAAVDWVVANWPQIQATIETVMNAISAVISTVVTYISTFWAANGETIVANSITTWGTIQSTISTIIATVQAIITTTLTAIQSFWTAHGESIMFIVTTMMTNTQASIQAAITIIQAIITTTLTAIQSFWDTWGVTIMAIVSNMTETIGAVIEGFAALLKGDWETLGTSLETIWDNTWENAKLTMGMAATSIGTIISDMVTSIGVAIVNFTTDLIAKWTVAWTSIQNTVTTILASILVTITTTVGNIAAAFDQDWPGLGMAIIGGIQSGIGSAVQGLVDAAVNAAIAAYNAALQALGIGSPSKLFAGIGKNVIESMGDSMTRATPMAMDAAHRAAQLISSAMQAGVIAPVAGSTNDLISPVSATRSPTGGSSSTSTTDARTYNLNATTDRTMQSVRSEFSTMQTLAGA